MGNMAGVFVILLGVFVAVVGLRGTHAAVFTSTAYGNLFANTTTVTTDSTAQAASNAANSSKKPQPVVPGGIILPPITLPGIGTI